MTEKTIAEQLRAPFPDAAIGKLPRVTCGDCSDRDKKCNQHERQWCDICKSTVSVKHIHIDYVGHADVTDRLLEVDPDWSWAPQMRDVDPELLKAAVATNDIEIIQKVLDNAPPKFELDQRGNPVGLWITLSIAGKTRPGYGSVPSNQKDAEKVLIGDAIRNAAMRCGVALDQWRKGERADPGAENPTGSAGHAQRHRGQRRDEPAAPQQPAPVDDGDWGPWRDTIDQIATREDAALADEYLRQQFTEGRWNSAKAHNIRDAIKAKAASLPPTPAVEYDDDAQKLAAKARAAKTKDALEKVHQEAVTAGKLQCAVKDYDGKLLNLIAVLKAQFEAAA